MSTQLGMRDDVRALRLVELYELQKTYTETLHRYESKPGSMAEYWRRVTKAKLTVVNRELERRSRAR